MAKALKPLIIILLVLSIASLVLSIMLFTKREVLKARAQRLEQATVEVAKNLRFETYDPTPLIVEDKESLPNMEQPLRQLAAYAGNQYEELQNTKHDLAVTKEDLAQTKDELAATRTRLQQAEDQIAQLNERIVRKDAELAQAQTQIEQLEQDKVSLQSQIDDLNSQIAKIEDESHDLKDKIVTLEQTIRDLEIEFGIAEKKPLPKGLTGKILVVNKDWNFVVLDIGSDKGLVPQAEMLVHRSDKLIGKVQISGVSRNMAIAEIERDWMQSPIREGDFVVY